MLIRFIVRNFLSFKEQTEFNMLPSNDILNNKEYHKKKQGDISILQYSAIYGANGSGKSNLLSSLALFQHIILEGTVEKKLDQFKFKLCENSQSEPSSFGIEFCNNRTIFFYTISFNEGEILSESLEEKVDNDFKSIFERYIEKEKTIIKLTPSIELDSKGSVFLSNFLSERIIQKNTLLLIFLATKLPETSSSIKEAYDWIKESMNMVSANAKAINLPHKIDSLKMNEWCDKLFQSLDIGIQNFKIQKTPFEKYFAGSKDFEKLEASIQKKSRKGGINAQQSMKITQEPIL